VPHCKQQAVGAIDAASTASGWGIHNRAICANCRTQRSPYRAIQIRRSGVWGNYFPVTVVSAAQRLTGDIRLIWPGISLP
jgi:hypothetical protein